MKKLLKFLALAQLVCLLIFAGMLLADKQTLGNDLVRLHVVGASDTEADQTVKLFVRDAIVAHTDKLLAGAQDADAACAILEANLDALTQTANEALMAAGSTDIAAVSLQRVAFPVRHYESFSLPSGVYRALRVKIGSAQGANWWCVVFPSLCMGPASEPAAAAGAGFSDSLTHTLAGEPEYRVSFFLLDCIGKLENFFFS